MEIIDKKHREVRRRINPLDPRIKNHEEKKEILKEKNEILLKFKNAKYADGISQIRYTDKKKINDYVEAFILQNKKELIMSAQKENEGEKLLAELKEKYREYFNEIEDFKNFTNEKLHAFEDLLSIQDKDYEILDQKYLEYESNKSFSLFLLEDK